VKKSKYEKERTGHWERLIADGQRLGERVLLDIMAAEAAGVVWDPEEEPLPERLHLGSNLFLECEHGRPLLDRDPDVSEGIGNYIAVPLKRWRNTEYCERVLAEAVRRFNACGELRRLAGLKEYIHPNQLLAILDAKP